MWTKLSAVRLTLPRTHFCLRRHLHAKSENIGHGSVKKNWAYYGAVSTFVGAAFYLQFKQLQAEAKHPSTGNGGKPKRTFTRKEVAEHSSVEKGVWVIFGNGVYDVTNFVPNHPGGSKIMLAAGASIEPFWKVIIFLPALLMHRWVLKQLLHRFIPSIKQQRFGKYWRNIELATLIPKIWNCPRSWNRVM